MSLWLRRMMLVPILGAAIAGLVGMYQAVSVSSGDRLTTASMCIANPDHRPEGKTRFVTCGGFID